MSEQVLTRLTATPLAGQVFAVKLVGSGNGGSRENGTHNGEGQEMITVNLKGSR